MLRRSLVPSFLSPTPLPPRRRLYHVNLTRMSAIPSIQIGHPPKSPAMPQLGLGTWKSPSGVTQRVVSAALRAGYTHLDCACDYGNEAEVGAGISSAIAEGVVTRRDIFITSKLWNTFHRREHVRMALMRTLADLRLQHIDLYLIHFPIPLKFVPLEKRYPPEWVHDPNEPGKDTLIEDRVPLAETWAALETLADQKLIKHLGVSNFPVALLMDLLSYARIKPAVLQVEMHPYLQQERLLQFCKREGIAVTAFSPLGSGSYVQLGMDKGDRLLEDPVLKRIAAEKGKSVAQIALRWAVQRGTGVIPKTEKEERLVENMSVFDFELGEEDMLAIRKLDRGRRYNDPGEFCVGMGKSIPIYD